MPPELRRLRDAIEAFLAANHRVGFLSREDKEKLDPILKACGAWKMAGYPTAPTKEKTP